MQTNKESKMANAVEVLKERGFIEQTTHEKELYDLFDKEEVTCYIGFDPTASSLHVGSLVPIMSLAHMQRNGHRPIALVGGGTGLVGDPSGKTEMRKMLSLEIIEENLAGIRSQLARFINFKDQKALMVNNADWLTKLEYIPFLRDFGRYFSVNRMIKAESYKMRLDSEEGLNFIEFNYMVLQSYDFYELFKRHGCRVQMGGSDQWGNIVAGSNLVRKVCRETVFGITFPLVTTANGKKMGKTAEGAVWLDPEKTSPYDYFQFWVNTEDSDVARFLALFTFLPIEEIREAENLEGRDLNNAKTVLAFEATLIAHGLESAQKAYEAAASLFGLSNIPMNILPSSSIPREAVEKKDVSVPCTCMDKNVIEKGIPAFKLFNQTGLSSSGGEARRLIKQGGAYINGKRIDGGDYLVTDKDADDKEILLRAGKKKYHKIILE